ncbi:helix-turn-helix domain-containing protein [Sinorhizobium medicae]
MDLRAWRTENGLTMSEAATLLSIESARTYQRYETGENRPDAPLVERIRSVSGGLVMAEDLHRQRLEWLKSNKPETVASLIDMVAEAAE